jgi:hypothetical protein
MNIYAWAANQINSVPKYNTGFTQLMGKNPYFINSKEWNGSVLRLILIKEFMRLSLEIFKDVLFNNADPVLKHWLLNETPSHIAWEYHRSLHDRHFSLPVFFRTDESSLGKIMEINCPGSLWGELQLAYEYALLCGEENESKSPAKLFASQLSSFLGRQPVVHYLLDGATVQPGMRYFIEKTRPEIQYANIDKGIRSADCNFIRNHFFWGLCNELYFLNRLPRIGIDVFYDLPPHVLFSQKAALVLPFWSKTRKYFSDEIRNIINYSVPLLPEGLELESGLVSIDEFCNLSRKKRGYYLKYAGSNVSMNWGSREVNRLSILNSDKCRALLKKCIENYNSGEIWLLQKEDTHDDVISYSDRNSNEFQKKFRLKLSSFYGPDNCIGMLAMHRNFYKVHGQNDTVISCVLPHPNK